MQPLSTDELISELGKHIGIPGLRADAQGCCHLVFDGSLAVVIRHVPAQSRWLLSCALEKQTLDAEGLRLLLRGNWLGAGFGGGWVGLDEQDRAVLHLPVPFADASASVLLQATEMLLDHAERWDKRLKESPQAGQRAPAPMAMWAQRI